MQIGRLVVLEQILDKLEKVRRTGKDRYTACCPVHGDKNPSMSLTEKDGRVLIHCFACNANGKEVVEALGLPISVLFEKPLERTGEMPKRIKEELELDRYVIAGAEQMQKKGQRLSYSDYKRLKLARHRMGLAEEWSQGGENNVRKMLNDVFG
jgi:hypothetical protein